MKVTITEERDGLVISSQNDFEKNILFELFGRMDSDDIKCISGNGVYIKIIGEEKKSQ